MPNHRRERADAAACQAVHDTTPCSPAPIIVLLCADCRLRVPGACRSTIHASGTTVEYLCVECLAARDGRPAPAPRDARTTAPVVPPEFSTALEPVLAPDGSLCPEPAEIRALLTDGWVAMVAPANAHAEPVPCVVGDTGWVRESWRVHRGDDGALRLQYHADGTSVPLAGRVSPAGYASYEAAVRDAEAMWASTRHDAPAWDAFHAAALFLGPLAMPRAFCRVHVRVDAVRRERVQTIVDGAVGATTRADADLAWRLLEGLFVAVGDRGAASAEAVARAGSVGAALARRWDECQWLSTRGTTLWGALTAEPVETATIWMITLRAVPEATAERGQSLR